MYIKAGLLLVLLSIILINCINGQEDVTFTITNEEAPGSRPDTIPNRQAGNIGRYYYTVVGGRVDITAIYDVQGTPEEEVKLRWLYNGEEIMFSTGLDISGSFPEGVNTFSTKESVSVFTDNNWVYVDTNIETFTSILYIQNIDSQFHPGNYTFEVYSGNDRASATSLLILGRPPELITTPPGSINPPGTNQENVDFIAGGKTVLCNREFVYYATFSGDPAPVVVCTDARGAGTQVIQTNNNPQQTSVRYTLGPFAPGDVVTITCTATNDHGSATHSVDATTLGSPPVLSPNTPARLDCTSASASVSVGMNERGCALEGTGVVTFTHALQSEEDPVAEIKWFHRSNNGVVREVTEEGRFTIRRQGLNLVLQIVRPEQSDEGEYFITATNCAGTISSDSVNTVLEVFMRPVIDLNQPPIPPPGSCQEATGFTTVNVRSSDITVRGNPPVCITCPASGDPPATFSWTRDGVAVSSATPFLELSALSNRVQPHCFTCTATNLAGSDQSEVCVQAVPNVEYRLDNRGCTRTCGGGVIAFQVVCVEIGEGGVGTPVDESLCIQQQIPRPQPPTETCGNVICPPQFILGPWTPCSSSCEEGVRTRIVRCRQIDATGIQRFVALSVCTDFGLTAPEATERCNAIRRIRRTGDLNPCPVPENFMFETSPWSACTETCHRGRRTRTVRCREIDRENNRLGRVYPDRVCIELGHAKPDYIERCATGPCNNYGIWRCGGWSECSSSCGSGGQIRRISCYDPLTKSESANCFPYYRPTSFRECNPGPCLQTPECRDSPYYHCYVLRDAPLYCQDNRYVAVCCKTCEDVIFRPVTTTTTPAPTTPVPTTTVPVTTASTTAAVITLPAA